MPKLKPLTAKQLLTIFAQFGFAVVSQKGSHIKIARTIAGNKQTLTIPNHHELDPGTCRAIMRQAGRFISIDQLYPHFYSE
ncbi:type II toxin-antitoxin system HicA family toxin [Methylomonas koyamae]|uniref:type II toxin-antitoxin system HicA family toxin n=1 Tax=Methylomonas koyamae TaxID=702114 RepID=UPI002872EC50|nr:type II toxin-antitoxin system HicA family toxin [Methylomonas koyamae]WNB77616.1 type II toxin-antitoxin system HicA family toxin [Methylomonas koyamae]